MDPYLSREQVCSELKIRDDEFGALLERGLLRRSAPTGPERYRRDDVRMLRRLIGTGGQSVDQGIAGLLQAPAAYRGDSSGTTRSSHTHSAAMLVPIDLPAPKPPQPKRVVAAEEMFSLRHDLECASATLVRTGDAAVTLLNWLCDRGSRSVQTVDAKIAPAFDRLTALYSADSLALLPQRETASIAHFSASLRLAEGLLLRAALTPTLETEQRRALAEGLALAAFLFSLEHANEWDQSKLEKFERINAVARTVAEPEQPAALG